MAIKEVEGQPGYVYDDSKIRTNSEGKKYADAYIDSEIAREKYGMTDKQIEDKRNSETITVDLD